MYQRHRRIILLETFLTKEIFHKILKNFAKMPKFSLLNSLFAKIAFLLCCLFYVVQFSEELFTKTLSKLQKINWSEITYCSFFTTRILARKNKAHHILTGGVRWMCEVGQLCLVGRGYSWGEGGGWGEVCVQGGGWAGYVSGL